MFPRYRGLPDDCSVENLPLPFRTLGSMVGAGGTRQTKYENGEICQPFFSIFFWAEVLPFIYFLKLLGLFMIRCSSIVLLHGLPVSSRVSSPHCSSREPRVHKSKSMQRLISSILGTGTAKFLVTWLLRIVQKGVSVWQCCAVNRWLLSGACPWKTLTLLSHFFFLFSSRKIAERLHKGKKVRWF